MGIIGGTAPGTDQRADHYAEAQTLTAELDQWRLGELNLPGTTAATPLSEQLAAATVQLRLAEMHFRFSQGAAVFR